MDILEDNYCGVCGRYLIRGEITSYNKYNGMPIWERKCPSNMCDHYGVSHDFQKKKGFFGMFGDYYCTKCGEKSYFPVGYSI